MNHTSTLKITGAHQVGSPSTGQSTEAVHAPRPHVEHRQELPVEPLPEPTSHCRSDDEPVWRGATRMLSGLAGARSLHPAGRARV